MIYLKKTLFAIYALIGYAVSMLTLVYMAGFLGNFLVPNTIDGPQVVSTTQAIITNLALMLLFALQHSIMARKSFKERWVKIVPKPIERTTYGLFSCVALLLLFHFWEPINGVIWEFQSPTIVIILYSLYFLGWTITVVSTFQINHWDLFGLRQVYLYLRNRPYTALDFSQPTFYKQIRHPLYFGFLIAFWATPIMTVPHLLFSIMLSAYIFKAIQLEEKDLIFDFKERYLEYQKKVPMLFPVKRN